MEKSNPCFLFLLVFSEMGLPITKLPSSCLSSCTCNQSPAGLDVMCKNADYRNLPFNVANTPAISLNLANNYIEHLDMVSISQWPMLQTLNLSSNSIKSIRKSTEDFSPQLQLKTLDLSWNCLQILHSSLLSGLSNLKALNLSHNQLHTLANGAFQLPMLVHLDLTYNKLVELQPHLLESSPKLEVMSFSHNTISRLVGNDNDEKGRNACKNNDEKPKTACRKSFYTKCYSFNSLARFIWVCKSKP